MNGPLLKNTESAGAGGRWSQPPDHSRGPAGLDRAKAAKVGLRMFLVVVTSLFLLFLLAFIARSQMADWQPLTEPLAPLASARQLWLNTVLLVLGSISLQWARMVARRGVLNGASLGFALGGIFAIAFLGGQLWVWKQFVDWGYFVSANPANSFFYLLTGVHGLHLLGGLVAWGRVGARFLRRVPLSRLAPSVELCAIYWHYLLGLWIVLFALLTSTPETYQAIAAFCGLR
ncbi:cytochrome C oxidase subunit III [Pseudomonas chlororaphis]|jgi:cytochrome c oxidase subunit III|uniref:cytochrome c oxidase subunit 3 n=1 Tax=Pseudomonas chlororaphis TaxID=587753 RepID=UPI000F47259B|nr:cytochrome c oxidase subunit 3 [Pseudomonas chlororaphis]RON83418.1 cytochrome C oxidase subunit III [Pseudomonas chlororaphis]